MADRKRVGQSNSIVAVIGDEDTVTGFLLTGVGEKSTKQETNYLIVGPNTQEQEIIDTFKRYLKQKNVAVILVTQALAEKHLRHIINNYEDIIPTILEIPSKDSPYDPKKDNIIQNAYRMLYGAEQP